MGSGCGVLLDDGLDLAIVCGPVLFKQIVCIGLGWRFGVGIVQQVLDAQENLLDGDCWLPTFLLIQYR